MPKITIQLGLTLPPEDLARLEALNFLPGEKVKVDPKIKFSHEDQDAFAARVKLFEGRNLQIEQTLVSLAENGGIFIDYIFHGIEGKHNAQAFVHPNGYKHDYGVLITRNGHSWFVGLSSDLENPTVTGDPRLIDSEITRSARHCFCINDENNSVKDFLDGHENDPQTGEYVLIPNGDRWMLDYSPWMSGSSPIEIQKAEQAISAYLENTATVEQDQADDRAAFYF